MVFNICKRQSVIVLSQIGRSNKYVYRILVDSIAKILLCDNTLRFV